VCVCVGGGVKHSSAERVVKGSMDCIAFTDTRQCCVVSAPDSSLCAISRSEVWWRAVWGQGRQAGSVE
jgi:hypothetical protein